MSKPKVVLTRAWPKAVEAAFAARFDVVLNTRDRAFSEGDMADAIRSADAVLSSATDRVGANAIPARGRRAQLVAHSGSGDSAIDLAAARERGLHVTVTPDDVSEDTADLTLMLIMMTAAQRTNTSDAQSDRWWDEPLPVATGVSGKTLGIVGFGRVGQEVARRASQGFGMDVLVHDVQAVADGALDMSGAKAIDTLDNLLPECDFVSLHCQGTLANRHLINARRLDLMKPDAVLINTTRGDVVDDFALTTAIMHDCIGGVGMDVDHTRSTLNPYLRQCDSVAVMERKRPVTPDLRTDLGLRLLDNIAAYFEGRAPRDLVV